MAVRGVDGSVVTDRSALTVGRGAPSGGPTVEFSEVPRAPIVGRPTRIEFKVAGAASETVRIDSANAPALTWQRQVHTGSGAINWVPQQAGPARLQIVVRGADGHAVEAATNLTVRKRSPRTARAGQAREQSMATQPPHSPDWRQPVAMAAACAVLGLLTRVVAGAVPAPVAMIGLGAGLLGASLLLSWAADAAEVEVSGGMVVAGITLVTVLPELIIEVHFAYTQQTSLVSANLTGATRLLLTGATAMPVLGAWLLARRGQPPESFTLAPARRVDLALLFVAALYGVLLALLGRVSLIDGLLLLALYGFYLRRIRGNS